MCLYPDIDACAFKVSNLKVYNNINKIYNIMKNTMVRVRVRVRVAQRNTVSETGETIQENYFYSDST